MILLTLFDRVRWMPSQEFASFLYDVQLRAGSAFLAVA